MIDWLVWENWIFMQTQWNNVFEGRSTAACIQNIWPVIRPWLIRKSRLNMPKTGVFWWIKRRYLGEMVNTNNLTAISPSNVEEAWSITLLYMQTGTKTVKRLSWAPAITNTIDGLSYAHKRTSKWAFIKAKCMYTFSILKEHTETNVEKRSPKWKRLKIAFFAPIVDWL